MKIPNKMKYIEIKKFGPAEGLKLSEIDVPDINKNEVLIKVFASGVNRPDILQRLGQYPSPKRASTIPGLEVAGKIIKIGEDVYIIPIFVTVVVWPAKKGKAPQTPQPMAPKNKSFLYSFLITL